MIKDEAVEKAGWEAFWRREPGLIRWGRGVYNRWFLRRLRPFLTPDSDFLEVGCGTGSLHAALQAEVRSLTGLDFVEDNITFCRKMAEYAGHANRHYVVADCHRMPFDADRFDIVWSQGLIEHYDTDAEIIREQLRVCRAGGRVIISVPYAYSYMALWYGVSRLPGLRRLWPWTDQRFYSHADLRHLFARVGADGVETHVSLLAPAWAGVIIGTIRKPGGAAESRVTHAG